MEKQCQLYRYVKGTAKGDEALTGTPSSLHQLLCKQQKGAVSTQKKFTPVLGPCTI